MGGPNRESRTSIRCWHAKMGCGWSAMVSGSTHESGRGEGRAVELYLPYLRTSTESTCSALCRGLL